MWDANVKMRRTPTYLPGDLHQVDRLSSHCDRFQEDYEASRQKSAAERFLQGFARAATDAALPESGGWATAARTTRLGAENDRLRAQETLLLDQLAMRNAELAARDAEVATLSAEILDLKAQLSAWTGEDTEQVIPHRLPAGAVRVRAKVGAVRRGVPFIHPEDLSVEDE